MTLTDFLLARLAEDEWEAQRALSTLTNEINHAHLLNLTSTREEILAAPHLGATIRRMFAEVEAKRSVVEWCADGASRGPWPWKARKWVPDYYAPLRALALPYVDHPDYRQEWKP